MKLSEICIRRPVFATVLSLILIIVGILGYSRLATRFLPDYQRKIVNIQTNYSGASAAVIERSITTPIEQELSGIPGVAHVLSVSQQGVSLIQLDQSANYDRVLNTIQSRVNLARNRLPSDLQTSPMISKGFAEMPVMLIAIYRPGWSTRQVQDYVDRNIGIFEPIARRCKC